MNCKKLECVPRAPRQNLSESLTFIDPDLLLLSLIPQISRRPVEGSLRHKDCSDLTDDAAVP